MASTRTASWESERRYDKRQELRGELWEEDNPGLAAYMDRRREEKSEREENERRDRYVKAYFYMVALPGWATTVDSPEILIWVNQVLSKIQKVGFDNVTFGDSRLSIVQRKAWPTDTVNMYGGKYLSDESQKEIKEFVKESLSTWPLKFVSKNAPSYFEWFENNIPQKLEKYKALASKYKTYVPPPNVRIPSAPVVKTVVDAEAAEKIQILTDLSGKIQDPTIAQVLEAYTAGAKPTEDQLKKIRNLLYRSRMAPEADKFRVASVPRVVALHLAKSPSQVVAPKDRNRETYKDPTKNRDRGAIGLIERGGAGAGKHKNKQDFDRGHSRAPKHKGRGYEEGMEETINASSVEGEMKKISPPVEAEPSSELVARAHVAAQSPGYAITNPLRFGLMPLAFMYGQILEQPRQMVVLSGESLRVIKTKKIVVLVGVDERGQPILARNEAELKAKTEALNQSRLHHESAR